MTVLHVQFVESLPPPLNFRNGQVMCDDLFALATRNAPIKCPTKFMHGSSSVCDDLFVLTTISLYGDLIALRTN